MDHYVITQKQLEAIPGIGEKSAWKLISQRVKRKRKNGNDSNYENPEIWFNESNVEWRDAFGQFFKII